MTVKFIGGPIDGQVHEITKPLPVYRVPVPPKGTINPWAKGGDFDPSTVPDLHVEEYKLYQLPNGNFYLHASVNADARLAVELMDWPEVVEEDWPETVGE